VSRSGDQSRQPPLVVEMLVATFRSGASRQRREWRSSNRVVGHRFRQADFAAEFERMRSSGPAQRVAITVERRAIAIVVAVVDTASWRGSTERG
jgi:hypothetical protein